MLRILTDTTSCLSPEAGLKHGIVVVPQLVLFKGKQYLEWVELTPAQHLEMLQDESALPASRPISVDGFEQALRPLVEAGDSVICIHPSRKLSEIMDIVGQAASRFPNADIRVLDSDQIASPMATMAIQAAEWARQGVNVNEVIHRLNRLNYKSKLYFLVATLDYLQRGGRIGGAKALIGKLLGIKPVLALQNGQVDQFETARTFRHGVVRLKELVVSLSQDEDTLLSVMHAGDPQSGQQLAQELAWTLNLAHPVPVYDIPPSVATHTGPGTLGVSFFR